MPKFAHKICLFALGMIITLSLNGCSGTPPNPDGKVDVSGTITLNGEPIHAGGLVSFKPLDAGGSPSRASVRKGKYMMTQQDALKPGKYSVSFKAIATFDTETDTYRTADTPDFREYTVQLIPEDYSKKNPVEFEVVAGKKNVFDYDVKTDISMDELVKKYRPKKQKPATMAGEGPK